MRPAKTKREPVIAGLTGLILSGKSTVCRFLEKRGIAVLDCDRIARDLISPGTPLAASVAKEFGPAVLDSSGRLDREKLASAVFSSPQKRKKLERMTHPAIIRELFSRAPRNRISVAEAALLFESGLYRKMALNIYVDSDLKSIYRRRRERKLSLTRLSAILRAQTRLKNKKRMAGIVIGNHAGLGELEMKSELLAALLNSHEKGDKRKTVAV